MAPDASPSAMSNKTGVRRVNNMPVYILAAVVGAFLLVMMLVAMDRAAKQAAPAQDVAEKAGSTSMFVDAIVGNMGDGGVVESPEILELAPTPMRIVRPDNLDAPPLPPGVNLGQPQPHDDEADRIRMTKLQMFQEAVKAKTGVRADVPRGSGSGSGSSSVPQTRDEMLSRLAAVRQQIGAQSSDDPTAAYQARLAQLRASGVGGQQGGAAPRLLQTSSSRDGYAQFTASGESDRWRLDSQPEAPRTPYVLRAGAVIPAVLISGINSDLPGQILAQVSQHVYDTPTGKHLMIPQGARLVGAYSSDVAYGQARVLVAWQRIIFPDGTALDIGAMPGADGAGYSGLGDQVNNHYLRVFGSAFLMSGVVAAISLSQDRGGSGDQQRASDAMSEALGQVLGNTVSQLVSKNLGIAPTLEIRPGYRLNVVVTKDLTFFREA